MPELNSLAVADEARAALGDEIELGQTCRTTSRHSQHRRTPRIRLVSVDADGRRSDEHMVCALTSSAHD